MAVPSIRHTFKPTPLVNFSKSLKQKDHGGDGHDDIVLQNAQGLKLWQMNGTTLNSGHFIPTGYSLVP